MFEMPYVELPDETAGLELPHQHNVRLDHISSTISDDGLPDLFEAEETVAESAWQTMTLNVPSAPPLELQPSVAAVWGSSRNVACYLCANSEILRGQRVVELGAGAGLPSLVAASLGAAHVVATDVDKFSVEAMQRHADRNRLSDRVVAARLDWAAHEACAEVAHDGNGWSVILAADCNYTTKAVPPLLRTIDALLARPGTLLLASREQRIGLSECLASLAAAPSSSGGGLGLRLERVVTFSEEGDTWTEGTLSNVSHLDSTDQNGSSETEATGAAHKLWVFRRDAPPSPAAADGSDGAIYFETQRLMRCACHALNNLVGRAAFTPADLDGIATSLGGSAYSLEHRWPLVGNYDVSVVLMALGTLDFEASWWDARKSSAELVTALGADDVVGALVNVRSRPRLFAGLVPLGRHWAALRKCGTRWADVDSNLAAPLMLGDNAELLHSLERALNEQGGHVFVVRRSTGGEGST